MEMACWRSGEAVAVFQMSILRWDSGMRECKGGASRPLSTSTVRKVELEAVRVRASAARSQGASPCLSALNHLNLFCNPCRPSQSVCAPRRARPASRSRQRRRAKISLSSCVLSARPASLLATPPPSTSRAQSSSALQLTSSRRPYSSSSCSSSSAPLPPSTFVQIVDALENADPDIDTITLSNAPGSSGQRFGLDALYGRTIAELGFKCVP